MNVSYVDYAEFLRNNLFLLLIPLVIIKTLTKERLIYKPKFLRVDICDAVLVMHPKPINVCPNE